MKTTKLIGMILTFLMVACLTIGTAHAKKFEYRPEMSKMKAFPPEYLAQFHVITWNHVNEAAIEPDNDQATAFQLGGNFNLINAHVDAASDQNDYFKIVLSETSTIISTMTWTTPDAWMNLYIYDSNIDPVTYDNMQTPSPKSLVAWQVPAGTYYLRVKALQGASDYQLKLASAGQVSETENDTLATTPWTLPLGTDTISVIGASEDPVDYLQVNIPNNCKSATLTLDSFGPAGSNVDLQVYGPNGYLLMTSSASDTYESLSSDEVPSGTYVVAVKSISGRAIYMLNMKCEVDLKIHIPEFKYKIPVWLGFPDPPPIDEIRNQIEQQLL
jgi:hypothetical protein